MDLLLLYSIKNEWITRSGQISHKIPISTADLEGYSLGLPRSDRNCHVWSSRDSRLPNRSRRSIGKDLVVLARSMQYAARTIPPADRLQTVSIYVSGKLTQEK